MLKIHRMIKNKIKLFYTDNKFILNHSFISMFFSAIGMVLLVIQNIMIARFFGDYIYGIFSFTLNLFVILSIFSKFGIENFSSREIPKLLNSPSDLKGVYYFSIIRTILFSCLIILFIYLCSLFFESFNLDFKTHIFIIGIWFLFRVIVEVFSYLFQSINKTISSRLILSILPPIFSIIFLIINNKYNYFIFDFKLIFQIIMLSYFMSFILILSFSTPFHIKSKEVARFNIKKWMKTSFNLMILSGLFLLLSRINPLILARYYPIEFVGYYTAVINISALISFGLHAANKILAPKLSEYYHNNKMDLFQKNLTLSARIGFIFSIILVVPFLIIPNHILGLYGNNFTQFSNVLIILSFGHIINSFCGPVGLSMIMTGNEKIVALYVFISLMINVILSFILIPIFGVTGLAVSNCIGMICWNIMLVYYAKNKYNYRTTILA